MAMDHAVAIAIFHRALEAEIGIAVETTNAKMMREELQAAKRAEADPELDKIITYLPAGLEEVWLVKKETRL